MRAFALCLTLIALAGCSGDGRLMDTRDSNDGPDEFAIVPTKPLTMPQNLAELPTPTPGGNNLTDPQPEADAVAALGGNPARLAAQGIGAGDGGLVNYASRLGRDGNIRGQLAAEDQAFRARHGRRPLEILAKTNVYYRAYGRMTLDSWAELERWRNAGVPTPAAPPK